MPRQNRFIHFVAQSILQVLCDWTSDPVCAAVLHCLRFLRHKLQPKPGPMHAEFRLWCFKCRWCGITHGQEDVLLLVRYRCELVLREIRQQSGWASEELCQECEFVCRYQLYWIQERCNEDVGLRVAARDSAGSAEPCAALLSSWLQVGPSLRLLKLDTSLKLSRPCRPTDY